MLVVTRTIFIFIIVLISTKTLLAQDHLFYVSIQGNWDKQKQKDKAQFGGDNKLINTYFSNFTKDLLRSGNDTNGAGKISFMVRTDGIIDSLVIIENIGQQYDSSFYKIILSMSGKWRAGQINGVKKDEFLTIWYNVYKGPKSKKSMEEYISEANRAIEKGDFKKALKSAENALKYDVLNVEAITIKTKAFVKLNQREMACDFIKPTLKYNNLQLTELVKELCK